MNRRYQFSIATVLLLMTLFALLFVADGVGWLFLLATELLVVFLCVETLVRNIPRAISSAMETNCYRADGTRSAKRRAVERQALRQVRWDLAFLFFLVLVPITCVLMAVEKDPLSAIFRSDVTLAAESSSDVPEQVTISNSNRPNQGKSTLKEQRDNTALKVMGYTALVIFGLMFFVLSWFSILKKLSKEIEARWQIYKVRDVNLIPSTYQEQPVEKKVELNCS